MPNEYYENEMSYLYALSDIMKEEYRAITDAGLTLQIDSPDAAMGRHSQFWNKSTKEFRTALAQRIEALNHALEGLRGAYLGGDGGTRRQEDRFPEPRRLP